MKTQNVYSQFRKQPLPNVSFGVRTVWMRNFLHFRYTLWVTLAWIFFDPFLYLVAIGYGLGNYVSTIKGGSYLDFYFPALLCVTSFSVPFFESTYNYYTKLRFQKVYQTILMTPVSVGEIVWAELLWGAFKGLLSAMAVAIVGRLLSIYETWMIFPAFGVLFLLSFLGTVCGFLFTTFAPNYDFFNYAVSGFLLPLTFFSDTYFPIEQVPKGFQALIGLFPLVHGVRSVRALLTPETPHGIGSEILILMILAAVLTHWLYRRFRRLVID